MTTPKVSTVSRGGSRFYVHPTTRGKVPGVTSVVGMLPKPFLVPWAAKMVAETAVDSIGGLVSLAVTDPQGAVDWLKGAHRRNTGDAADVGDEVHKLVEAYAQGNPPARVHPDYVGFQEGVLAFIDAFHPEWLLQERVVWSETHGYAGSFDHVLRIGEETIILDVKTTRSGVHAEVALQLAAYARADYMLDQDGTQTPLPKIDGAAVLHLRPDAWSLVPVNITDEVFDVFLHLLQVMEWEREVSKSALGAPVGGSEKTPAQSPARTRRRAPARPAK